MRIADKMSYNQVNRSISKNRTEMSDLQNQAATQKRVNKPSDDPVAASRVLFSRLDQRGNEQYVKNLNYAKGFLDFTEQSLQELTEALVRAKELALGQSNDASGNAQTRRVVATEIQQLYNQAVQIGNRKLGERFIFGGYKTTSPPFDENGAYLGDEGEMKVHIDKESYLSMNLPGSIVFHGKGLSKDGFVFHSLKQPTSLAEFKEQKAENPDRYQIPKGLEKTDTKETSEEQVTQRGPASLRTSENVAPTKKSEPAQSEPSAMPNGENIFDTFKKLEVALYTDDKAGIQESIDRIDDTLQQIIVARTSLGARVTNIDNTLGSMHTSIMDNKATVSQLEDADAFQVISDINKTESALQATLQTSGKLIQKSLLDFVS